MYFIKVDHVLYVKRDGKPRPARAADEATFTLVEAFREVRGCANAHILRETPGGRLVTVVEHAGRAYSPKVHGPSGQRLRQGSTGRPGLTRRSRGYWSVNHWQVVSAR